MDCIDEVARLGPARESEELVRGGIGEVETPAEFIVGLHRIKSKCRIVNPLELHRPIVTSHRRTVEHRLPELPGNRIAGSNKSRLIRTG